MQKTAYEMRISDWSSDVCSSDLGHAVGEAQRRLQGVGQPALQALPHHEAVDHHLDRVLLVAREVDLVGELVDLAVDASAGEALSSQVGEERVVGALTAADDRGEHLEAGTLRSEEHTSELQSLMRISYAVFCLKKKKNTHSNR